MTHLLTPSAVSEFAVLQTLEYCVPTNFRIYKVLHHQYLSRQSNLLIWPYVTLCLQCGARFTEGRVSIPSTRAKYADLKRFTG